MPASAQGPLPAQLLFAHRTHMAVKVTVPTAVMPVVSNASVSCSNPISVLQPIHSTSSSMLANPEAESPTSCKLLAAPVSEVSWEEEDNHWDHLHPPFNLGEIVLVTRHKRAFTILRSTEGAGLIHVSAQRWPEVERQADETLDRSVCGSIAGAANH